MNDSDIYMQHGYINHDNKKMIIIINNEVLQCIFSIMV